MPEVIRTFNGSLARFPAGEGKGGIYTPLPNEVKDGMLRAHAVQTILVEPQALYELWRDLDAAPLWMEYVVSVKPTSDTVSHWVLGDPADAKGKRIEFDSKIVEDEPGKRIAWQSITEGVDQNGEVTFEPSFNGRGTRVTLVQFGKVPGGAVGHALAGLTKRSPKQIVIESLRHFKELAEAGEIPSVEGQPNGPRGFTGSLKARMYGEHIPTPPGTSGQA